MSDLNYQYVPPNFKYPEITPEHYRFGSGELQGTPLRPDGDWRDYLPPEEDQNVHGIESSACYIEGQQHTIATLEEEHLKEIDNNYSARFNALLSNGSEDGGDPLKGAESIRTDGLIPDAMMPFGDNIDSWDDFHSWKDIDESAARLAGKQYIAQKKLGYDIIFEKYDALATKYAKLRRALPYSPCPISVTAWYEQDGIYYKPEGAQDNHLVEAVYIDDQNRIYIRDTYSPYLKILAPYYNPDFGMRWSVEKKVLTPSQAETVKKNLLIALYEQLLLLYKQLVEYLKKNPPPVPVPTNNLLNVMCLAIQKHEGWYAGSRSYRNMNPGNLRWAHQTQSTGPDKDGYAMFATYQDGFNTLKGMILSAAKGLSKVYKPSDTLYDFFNKFAPASDNNLPLHYAEVVASAMNVNPATFRIMQLL